MTQLHDYQIAARDFILSRFFVDQDQGVYLAADCGVGKTLIMLDTIRMLRDLGECSRTIILAPLSVILNTWKQEVEKHGYDFSVAVARGTPHDRLRVLQSDADIILINYENLQWMRDQNTIQPFDMLILDESTRVKSWSAKRSVAMRRMLRDGLFTRRVCLSGTPSPRSLGDLHSQYYMLDNGERLGRTVGWFRQRYMIQRGYLGREWFFRQSRTLPLMRTIQPITFRIDADDYLDLPELMVNVVEVDLPTEAVQQYRDMESRLFLALAGGATLTASGAGAKYVACKQIANGGLYETLDEGDRISHDIHTAKLDAVSHIVEESAGKPVLVVYQFNGDRDRLLQRFGGAPVICGDTDPEDDQETIAAWNRNEIEVLLVNSAALSHGVNMQEGEGRDIVWMGLTDQFELYLQLNARIHRQGVEGQVRVHHIVARGTVDHVISQRLENKGRVQQSLLDALNQYRLENQTGEINAQEPAYQGSV